MTEIALEISPGRWGETTPNRGTTFILNVTLYMDYSGG